MDEKEFRLKILDLLESLSQEVDCCRNSEVSWRWKLSLRELRDLVNGVEHD